MSELRHGTRPGKRPDPLVEPTAAKGSLFQDLEEAVKALDNHGYDHEANAVRASQAALRDAQTIIVGHGHDEGDETPLAADISLWKFFRATGVPPTGASDPDVDRAFDRIIRGSQRGLRLAEVLQEIAAYADDFPGSDPMQRVRDIAMEGLGDV